MSIKKTSLNYFFFFLKLNFYKNNIFIIFFYLHYGRIPNKFNVSIENIFSQLEYLKLFSLVFRAELFASISIKKFRSNKVRS
jgi:hypothetical protein